METYEKVVMKRGKGRKGGYDERKRKRKKEMKEML